MNFDFFMRRPVLQICTEQLILGVQFPIGHNNQHEIYPNTHFYKCKHLDRLDQRAI